MSDAPLNLERLGRYLEARIGSFSGLECAAKFAGGQSNPTYLLTARSGQYVLRRKPSGILLASAHAVDREYRLLKALEQTDVPHARALHLCEDDHVIGSMFYVMEYIDGRIFWNQALPELSNDDRSSMYDQMNSCLAAIHSVDLEAAGLTDFGKPGHFYHRQLSRWTKQYRASETEALSDMDALIDWLAANMVPDDGRLTLTHGDYRMDNVMWHPSEPRALAVIDWELATLGNPLSDLAYQCMQWRLPANQLLRGLAGVDRTASGIPTEQEYVELYCERTGMAGIENWNFYLAFAFFRLAAICQGVAKRAIDGNASDSKAGQVGALTPDLARSGLEVATELSG